MLGKILLKLLLLNMALFSVVSVQNVGGTGLFMPNNLALWFLVGSFIQLIFFRTVLQKHLNISFFSIALVLGLLLIIGLSILNSKIETSSITLFVLAFIGIVLFWFSLEQWPVAHHQFLIILLVLTALGGFHSLVSIIQLHDPFHVVYTLISYWPFSLVSNRPLGIVQQVNMNASLMATFALMGLYLSSYTMINRLSILWRIWIVVSVLMALYVVFLSGSRTGVLAFGFGFFLLVLARYKWLKKQPIRLLIWLFLIATAYYLAQCFPGLADSNTLLNNKFDKMLLGTDVRLYLYSTSWEMFWRSPWFGYGLGGYNDALLDYVAQVGINPKFKELELVTFLHPHNELLYWILQAGVTALVVLAGLIVLYLRLLFKRRLGFALGILALSFPILLQTQLSYPFSLSALHLFLLLFLLQYGIQPYVKSVRFSISASIQEISYVALVLTFVGWSYLSWFTLKSIEDAYAFQYRLFLTAEQTPKEIAEMHYFEYASKHPVFKADVEAVMNKTVEKALGKNNYDTQRFIWWAEEQAVENRSERTKENLSKARIALSH